MENRERFYAALLKKSVLASFITLFVFAFAYRTLAHVEPQSFAGITGESGIIDFIYFSFITFTTTGYGDIYPTALLGKILVLTEIVAGILFMALILYCNTHRMLARRKNK